MMEKNKTSWDGELIKKIICLVPPASLNVNEAARFLQRSTVLFIFDSIV